MGNWHSYSTVGFIIDKHFQRAMAGSVCQKHCRMAGYLSWLEHVATNTSFAGSIPASASLNCALLKRKKKKKEGRALQMCALWSSNSISRNLDWKRIRYVQKGTLTRILFIVTKTEWSKCELIGYCLNLGF